MANSKYEYVRLFEQPDRLVPNAWIVIRIDGRGFHKFTARHSFTKPNDIRALSLMNAAAVAVCREIGPDIVVAYGVSDEYSFVLSKGCELFERRASKLVTTITSTFTAYYVHLWSQFFPSDKPLVPPLPTFDGRAVVYPSVENIRDYMSWRQVDCHINNLYNTTFWSLVEKLDYTPADAEGLLKGTLAADKNEILFAKCGINYNKELDIFKKGSVVYRNYESDDITVTSGVLEKSQPTSGLLDTLAKSNTTEKEKSKSVVKREAKRLAKSEIVVEHIDIIKDDFWEKRQWILNPNIGRAASRFAGVGP